jgi:dTDP-4-amino-4,6-dideoxygalactose transaminase
MGRKYGRTSGDLEYTEELSERLVRLPLWLGMEDDLAWVIQQITEVID